MKKATGKCLISVIGLPFCASMLFAALFCLFSTKYYEWLWLPEWPAYLSDTISDFALYAAVFASMGIVGYHLFFGKWSHALFFTLGFALFSYVSPLLRYVVRHFCLASTASVEYMLEIFRSEMESALYFLLSFLLGVAIFWLMKGIFHGFLHKKTPFLSIFSLKNPITLSMMICFSALSLLSMILFFIVGEFAFTNIFSLFVEFAFNLYGFSVSVLSARFAHRVYGNIEKKKSV